MPRDYPPLPRAFYDREPAIVARELIGKAILRRIRPGEVVGGVILETEAYLAHDDPACHSHLGMKPKNRTMFGPPGHLYVYSIHAKYCMNAVTEPSGCASAVLIRALEPMWGIPIMAQLRGTLIPRDLCRGPGRLCQALGVNRSQDGVDLTEAAEAWIAEIPLHDRFTVAVGPRIGISKATELPLRFFVDRHPWVSGRAKDHSARPISHQRLGELQTDLDQTREGHKPKSRKPRS